MKRYSFFKKSVLGVVLFSSPLLLQTGGESPEKKAKTGSATSQLSLPRSPASLTCLALLKIVQTIITEQTDYQTIVSGLPDVPGMKEAARLLRKAQGDISAALLMTYLLPTSKEKDTLQHFLQLCDVNSPFVHNVFSIMLDKMWPLDQILEQAVTPASEEESEMPLFEWNENHGNIFNLSSDNPSRNWAKDFHIKIIDLLIHAGANINQVNKQGQTLLHRLSTYSNVLVDYGEYYIVKTLDLLINNGALIDTIDIEGYTPLLSCVETVVWDIMFGEYEEVMDLLLKAKADVNVINQRGESSLIIAIKYGYYDSGPDREQMPPEDSTEFTVGTTLTKLLESGATKVINHKDKKGNTALILETIKAQADLSEKNILNRTQGQTRGNYDILGKDIERNRKENHTAVLKILIEHGADITIRNNEGKTALDYAELPELKELILKLVQEKNNR